MVGSCGQELISDPSPLCFSPVKSVCAAIQLRLHSPKSRRTHPANTAKPAPRRSLFSVRRTNGHLCSFFCAGLADVGPCQHPRAALWISPHSRISGGRSSLTCGRRCRYECLGGLTDLHSAFFVGTSAIISSKETVQQQYRHVDMFNWHLSNAIRPTTHYKQKVEPPLTLAWPRWSRRAYVLGYSSNISSPLYC